MDPASYQRFTETLTDQLSQSGDVLALVALGSMAAREHLPDRFSDHDFFVIVRPGNQFWYRENRRWLLEHERIVFTFQETVHGMKVLYDNRHLLEFAVFDPEELHLARINRYRVLFDRANLTATLEQLAARETSSPAPHSSSTALSASRHPGRMCHITSSRWFAPSLPRQLHRRTSDRAANTRGFLYHVDPMSCPAMWKPPR